MQRKKEIVAEYDTAGLIRLNKYLSDAGVCSRRQADKLIEEGKVTVDQIPAVTGMRISRDQEVRNLSCWHVISRGGLNVRPQKRKEILLILSGIQNAFIR